MRRPLLIFTTPGRRCSAPLRKRRLDPYSLDTMPRSQHGASPKGCRPGPCLFNTIPGFRYGASLRGLRPNNFLSGFISIKVAKFLHWLATPNTTLLLYQGLGPAMLGYQKRPTIHFIKRWVSSISAHAGLGSELSPETDTLHLYDFLNFTPIIQYIS